MSRLGNLRCPIGRNSADHHRERVGGANAAGWLTLLQQVLQTAVLSHKSFLRFWDGNIIEATSTHLQKTLYLCIANYFSFNFPDYFFESPGSSWVFIGYRATSVEKMLGLKILKWSQTGQASYSSPRKSNLSRTAGSMAQWPLAQWPGWTRGQGAQAPLNKPLTMFGLPNCNPMCHLVCRLPDAPHVWFFMWNRPPRRSQMILELGQNGFNAQHISYHPLGRASAFPHFVPCSSCRLMFSALGLFHFVSFHSFFWINVWHLSMDTSKTKLCSSDSEHFLVQDALFPATSWWSPPSLSQPSIAWESWNGVSLIVAIQTHILFRVVPDQGNLASTKPLWREVNLWTQQPVMISLGFQIATCAQLYPRNFA